MSATIDIDVLSPSEVPPDMVCVIWRRIDTAAEIAFAHLGIPFEVERYFTLEHATFGTSYSRDGSVPADMIGSDVEIPPLLVHTDVEGPALCMVRVRNVSNAPRRFEAVVRVRLLTPPTFH